MPFHNPLFVALRLAQLDHQTRGRLMVGIGSGGIAADKVAFGINPTPEEAGRQTWEGIDLLLKYWRGEPVEHQGDFFQASVPEHTPGILTGVLMRPYQQPYPPLAIAGVNRSSYGLTRAGACGWLPLSTNFLPPDALAQHWASYASGAASTGRPADRTVWRIARDVHVAETSAQARREVRDGGHGAAYSRYMLPLVQHGGRGLAPFKVEETMPDEAVTVDYLIENVWIVGSVDEVAARLRALHAQVGGFGTLLQIGIDWAPRQDLWHRSMELLARRVMPQLADL
jgi:alkanesulfonate monooxygenase SsuD/methylene tetrahydromethanopterin reductase-like flavin-dependent oxidoreductase (luciferase family)